MIISDRPAVAVTDWTKVQYTQRFALCYHDSSPIN